MIEIVVKNELFPWADTPLREDAQPLPAVSNPSFRIAIGIARVVAESSQIALLGGIDVFVWAQFHNVFMGDAIIAILAHTCGECLLIDNLPNIFNNEIAGSSELAVVPGLDKCDFGILLLLKTLILTCKIAIASGTLHLGIPPACALPPSITFKGHLKARI
jgi:hypothetical protein